MGAVTVRHSIAHRLPCGRLFRPLFSPQGQRAVGGGAAVGASTRVRDGAAGGAAAGGAVPGGGDQGPAGGQDSGAGGCTIFQRHLPPFRVVSPGSCEELMTAPVTHTGSHARGVKLGMEQAKSMGQHVSSPLAPPPAAARRRRRVLLLQGRPRAAVGHRPLGAAGAEPPGARGGDAAPQRTGHGRAAGELSTILYYRHREAVVGRGRKGVAPRETAPQAWHFAWLLPCSIGAEHALLWALLLQLPHRAGTACCTVAPVTNCLSRLPSLHVPLLPPQLMALPHPPLLLLTPALALIPGFPPSAAHGADHGCGVPGWPRGRVPTARGGVVPRGAGGGGGARPGGQEAVQVRVY